MNPTGKSMVVVKHTFLEVNHFDVPAPPILKVSMPRARADSDSVIDYGAGLDYVPADSIQVLCLVEENPHKLQTTCRHGHSLRKHEPTVGKVHWCDTCMRNRIEAPELLLRCDECDFDMCMTCAGQPCVFDANTCAGSTDGFSPRGWSSSDSDDEPVAVASPHRPIMTALTALRLSEPSQPEEGISTVMIRNIACRHKHADIVKYLDDSGLAGTYDFVYLPLNVSKRANLGYVFVNFLSCHGVAECKRLLSGRSLGLSSSKKRCIVTEAHMQGDAAKQSFLAKQGNSQSSDALLVSSGRHTSFAGRHTDSTAHMDELHASLAEGKAGKSKKRGQKKNKHHAEFECMDASVAPEEVTLSKAEDVYDKTTVIVKEIPADFTRDRLVTLLDRHDFACAFDFVYVPHNFRAEKNFGYAFINFVSADMAERFLAYFADFEDWGLPSEKVAEVSYTVSHQGLETHVERYRDSPAMHQDIPDALKPALYCCGQRVAFPDPTKALKAPRKRMVRDDLRT